MPAQVRTRQFNLAIAACIGAFSFFVLIFHTESANFVSSSLLLFAFSLVLLLTFAYLPEKLITKSKILGLYSATTLLIVLACLLTLPAAPFLYLLPLIFLGASISLDKGRSLLVVLLALTAGVAIYAFSIGQAGVDPEFNFRFLGISFLGVVFYLFIEFLVPEVRGGTALGEQKTEEIADLANRSSAKDVYRAIDSLKGVLNYETLVSLIPYSFNSLFNFDQSFLFKLKKDKLHLESLHVGILDKDQLGKLMETCIGSEGCFYEELLKGEIAEITDIAQRLAKSAAGTTWARMSKIKKIVVVPLRVGNSLFGALVAASNNDKTEVDRDTLGVYSTTVVLALENATFYNKALETSEAYNAILTQMVSGVCITNNNNKITLLNNAGESLLGVKREAVLEKNVFDFITPFTQKGEPLPAEENPMIKAEKEPGLTFNQQVFISRSSGDRLPVDLSTKITRDEAGRKIGLVIVFRDVTKDLEIEKTRNEFISIASHELRTPMTAIKGFISMILDGSAGKTPPKVLEFLKMAQEGNERLIRLVEDLLNVSRIEGGRIQVNSQEVDLVEVTKFVVSDLMYHAGSNGVLVNYQIPADLPKIQADPDKLREILINLVGNGVKYTQKGGKVSIDQQVSGWKITTRVTDTGIGIPKEELPNLFKKFYRVPNELTMKREGTGLGLFITKQLAELMGGQLTVESEFGKGSTFSFSLPIVDRERQIVKISSKTKKVLKK